MAKIIRIGLDLSKQFFQVHGVDEQEMPILRKKLRRRDVVEFFARVEPTAIGIEACGGAHYWARVLGSLGHRVVLMAPQWVKPYVKRGKNDAADAEALCEAMSRPGMRFVPAKSADQQAALMLTGVRARLIGNRTQLTNTIRSYAMEFGLIAAKGLDKIEALLARIGATESLPELARDLFARLAGEYARLQEELAAIEAKLMAWHRDDEVSRRLAEIPGLGPIGSSLLAIKAIDARGFRSGRHFAAWIGLTPRDHSSGGKQRLGGITRAGDERLRSVMVVGAMAVIRQALRHPERAAPWLARLLSRKPPKLAGIALANKTARIAWKLMVSGERYRGALGTTAA